MQWTRPKSVRQIGEIPGRGRIYMEDYVIRFVKRLAEQSHGMEKAAVLLALSLNLALTPDFPQEKIDNLMGC